MAESLVSQAMLKGLGEGEDRRGRERRGEAKEPSAVHHVVSLLGSIDVTYQVRQQQAW